MAGRGHCRTRLFRRLADGMTWRALDDGKYADHADAAFVAADLAL
jgi:hypothetical protein